MKTQNNTSSSQQTTILSEFPHPGIHPLIQSRRSSRVYDPSRLLSWKQIFLLLEAARSAPSSGNRQPWVYLVFEPSNPEQLEKARSCLNPDNQIWANHAPLLLMAISQDLRPDGKENTKALHDLGMANQNLLLQATAMGLNCRPMAGFDADKARELFNIPQGYTPRIMIAVGYPGNLEDLPGEVQEKERKERTRKPINQFAFYGDWEQPLFEE
ncbi:MAG: nitroreductase [Bellilinea sp.]|nr:MAG: nitroreductase [Bellilinea sp.]